MCIYFFLATVFVGLFVGALLGYLRGRQDDSKALTFIFGVLLGGSASPFLKVEDTTQFRFHIYVLAGLSLGGVLGLLGTTWFMDFVYAREARRAEAQNTS